MIRLKSSNGSGTTPGGKAFGYGITALTGIGQSETQYQLDLKVDGNPGFFSEIVDRGQVIDFAGETWVF